MKKTLHIKATIDEEAFLEDMVEKLALRHTYTSLSEAKHDNKDLLETSSTETYVSGTIAIETADERINVPFITSFLFTCIKENEDTYSLEWGLSMS
ncbi:MAG TPA: hypothetical protein VFO37_11880 [Chitinophagaceae bacterium]|jgi:hypothetical protein|nr:hypothetical protein [Chitinophagaceae bacterium]